MLRLPVCLLLLTGLLSALSADPRPITHEDLWLMPRVGSPTISPDGRWVVVPVTEPAYDSKDQTSDLWIVPADGSAEPRRLTHTKGSEGSVAWSPDSSRIVFTARREGDDANQLYVLDLSPGGGEALRLTTWPMGARSPQWSPDGSHLLFISDSYPGAVGEAALKKAIKERKDRKHSARTYDGFPIRRWDRWLDDKQARILVMEAKPDAAPRDLIGGTALASLPGFAGQLTNSGETFATTWAPDGRSVVFVATTQGDAAAYSQVRNDLFRVGIGGGEPVRLTDDADEYSAPTFSPDGTALVVAVAPNQGDRVYRMKRLARFPWPLVAGQRQLLTGEFDLAVEDPVFSADGTRLYFTAAGAGLEKLYAVPLAGGPVTLVHDPKTGVATDLAAGGEGARFRLVGNWQTASLPPEVYAYNPADGKVVQLTRFTTARAAALDLPAVEHFTFTSAGGRPIHNLLVRPAGFDPARKYPLLTLIHGGPHSMYRDQWVLRWNYHLVIGTEYVLLLTNYTGSTGFGESFAQAIQGDPLKTPADEINQAVDEAIRRYEFVDGSRLAAGGASYGGHLANWLQATTTRYRCLVSHAGLVRLETQWGTSDVIYSRELSNLGPVWEEGPIWREQNPARLAGNHAQGTGWVTPMLITIGERDYRVPLANSLENWSLHQRLQIPSRLIVFPDENHWILKGENSRYFYQELRSWLDRWLKD